MSQPVLSNDESHLQISANELPSRAQSNNDDRIDALQKSSLSSASRIIRDPSSQSNEFELTPDVSRNVGVSQQPLFDVIPAKAYITETLLKTSPIFVGDSAPRFPDYLGLADTSFPYSKPLETLHPALERVLIESSVDFRKKEEGCGYSCSAFHRFCLVYIELNIYSIHNSLMVEFRNLRGCRFAFVDVYNRVAQKLGVEYTPVKLLLSPPPVPQHLASKSTDETRSREFFIQSLSTASRTSLIQGLEALGKRMEVVGDCGEANQWVPLAERVHELSTHDDEEIRTVAMGVLACMVSLEHVCGQWVDATIPTLVAGAKDDLPHLRREALRALHSLSTRNKGVAATLARAGVRLEIEATREDNDSRLNARNPSSQSDEFELTPDVSRNVGVSQQPLFDVIPAKAYITETPPKTSPIFVGDSAPRFPDYLGLADTSFPYSKPLETLHPALERVLIESSVDFRKKEEGCGYSCSAFHRFCLVYIELNIYSIHNSLMVEFRNLRGCRFAFVDVYNRVAQKLGVEYTPVKLLLSPPPVPQHLASKSTDETRSREFFIQSLSTASRTSLIQGLEALGKRMEVVGDCGEANQWVPLVERVHELSTHDDEEIRTVAMGVLAYMVSLEHVCGQWVDATIPTLVAGAKDDLPHLRREALRALHSLSTRNKVPISITHQADTIVS